MVIPAPCLVAVPAPCLVVAPMVANDKFGDNCTHLSVLHSISLVADQNHGGGLLLAGFLNVPHLLLDACQIFKRTLFRDIVHEQKTLWQFMEGVGQKVVQESDEGQVGGSIREWHVTSGGKYAHYECGRLGVTALQKE